MHNVVVGGRGILRQSAVAQRLRVKISSIIPGLIGSSILQSMKRHINFGWRIWSANIGLRGRAGRGLAIR